MKYSKFVREAYSYYEAYRRLGFKPDDIYIVTSDEFPTVGVKIEVQGKTFTATVTDLTDKSAFESFQNDWLQFYEQLQAIPETELQEIWDSSIVRANSWEFVAAIIKKGIAIPKNIQHLN